MRIFLYIIFLFVFSIAAHAQKKDTIRNYLGEDVTLPSGQFTFCGKKNGEKISRERIKSNCSILLFPELENREILKVKIVIYQKDSLAETMESASLSFSDEIKNKMLNLNPESRIQIQLYSKNKSTQIKNFSKEHTFIISGK